VRPCLVAILDSGPPTLDQDGISASLSKITGRVGEAWRRPGEGGEIGEYPVPIV
jgi:hypothetical protein